VHGGESSESGDAAQADPRALRGNVSLVMSRLAHLVLVIAVSAGAASASAQAPPIHDTGLRGQLLAPDGKPVSSGSVVLQTTTRRYTAAIDATGEFRVVPEAPGDHQLFIGVPNLAPSRVAVNVPPSRTAMLPRIQLAPPTYFRVRLITPEGEPVTAPRFRRQLLGLQDTFVVEPRELEPEVRTDADGNATIGPLPLGKTLLAVEAPPLAQTRLAELDVDTRGGVIDGGTVVLQPGARLHVEVIDIAGQPVANHDVVFEDAAQPSPLATRPGRTAADGRVMFDRVSAGRYRLRARLPARCGGQTLSVARIVEVPARGRVGTRLVLGGSLTITVSSPLGALSGLVISASPESGDLARPEISRVPQLFGTRPRLPASTSCTETTDANGRVTFENFPPGAARVDIRLPNSTFSRRVIVPEKRVELALAIPDGILPVRVINAATKRPIGNATVRWTSGGSRVEGRTVASGDALLESTGAAGGTVEAFADGYDAFQARLGGAAVDAYEVALTPSRPTALNVRVVNVRGEPVSNAVIGVFPQGPREIAQIAVTDARGAVTFVDAPSGALRVTVSADGFAPGHLQVAAEQRGELVLRLTTADQR
jgi:hypothetical protein